MGDSRVVDGDRREWVRAYYAKADTLDPDAFVTGMSEDVRIVMPGSVREGRDVVRASIAQRRASGMRSMRHDIEALWAPEPDVVIFEGTVTYHHDTGDIGPIPVVTIFRWRGGEVFDVRVYMDSAARARVTTLERS